MSDSQGPSGRSTPAGRPAHEAVDAELSRLRSEAAFHQRLQDLTVALSQGISSTLDLDSALPTLAADANRLLGANRTSVWLHERRAHELALTACSDAEHGPLAARIATDDQEAPAARGLRLERPEITSEGSAQLLLAPLRGWRRALGAVIFEGPFTHELDSSQLLTLAYELSRQLSSVVENIQLLEDILHQRRLLENTFNSIVDLVVVTDNALRIVQMNEPFTARVGRSRAELMEQPLATIVGSELAVWASAHDPGEPPNGNAHGERTCRIEDQRLGGTFAVTVTPLRQPAGEPAGLVVVARDITHQTRLEREREALRERLAQSEKLAALGQFVAGIAHEMNNPLQGVLGYLELMLETSEAARPLRRELRRIYQEANRAAAIVRNLLAFTGLRRMSRRRLRLHRVLSRAISSRARALQRAGIEVIRDDSADLPMIAGDPLLLHQAFLNVLINAEHAILSKGNGGTIELRSFLNDSRTRVTTTVRDTGPGIDLDVLPRMFDPFFTTKEVGKGTGLGLAITYGIVQDHGGSIHAANAPQGGAIITLELPAAEARATHRGR